jgi:selenocysteine-specific elongation factor
MYVIGTAGHVDHGKSTLVKALTGIDPDRLKEEKAREMTIDLGFAWLKLPNGEEVGVVDVPGHERLVRNMLAGVGGIDLALLIVAADEGVAPQTREHLAILDLLRVKSGIIVLTKKDLVDKDWTELVKADVQQAVAGTTFKDAPIVAVSAVSGEGLPELKALIAGKLAKTEPRKDIGRPRLPIDRSFVMTGFGTVVTGTLLDGSFSAGQEVEIVPKGLPARIRGLQTHKKKLETASPGRRLAVNLSGVDHTQLERGDVVATPGWLTTTVAFDARIQMTRDAPPLKHNGMVTLYVQTSEIPARVRLLDVDEVKAGEPAWAQVKLSRPAAIVKGDLFILRNSWGTIGGGEVIEPKAQRHKRFSKETLERLEVLEAGTPEEVALEAIASSEPCQAKALVGAASLKWDEAKSAIERLAKEGQVIVLGPGAVDEQTVLYSRQGFDRLTASALALLGEYHQKFSLRRGMPKEEVRNRLSLAQAVFSLVVQRLSAVNAIAEDGSTLRLPSHQAKLSPVMQKEADAYLKVLASSPYSPPAEAAVHAEVLAFLLEQGKVVRTSADVVFTAEAYKDMLDKVVAKLKANGKITLAEVRDMFGTSRKYVQSLLEYLDQQRITRRVGDERVLR